ncbi:carbohydrate ABC transporter permease [Kineosporia rhizophila]|uniref:carbohydrate ABC transporter permease n=1 Tax=Kineosporia TaxID=49184 RepID=UPI000B1F6142|nr:carbohydrate ABC transporter permease [Kineosporia sp. NBRC 101677]MCE0540504.1 carbohydrate ABC transporter permease [Kineosporia rhizophila]GLY18998.1 ABC transporter permease [Kineosporia sp. NBRC 101677]
MRTLLEVRRSLPRAAWWAACLSVAAIVLYPLWIMLSQSLKSSAEATENPPTLYPHGLSLDNYQALGNTGAVGIWTHVGNSVLVSAGATVLTMVLATLAGYGFAKLRFAGSGVLFFLILATFMIPFQAIITPLFSILHTLGLNNSLLGLVLVYTTFQLPFGIFLMRNSFAALPASIEEAALIDGCGYLSAMTRVMLPVAVPGLISTALFTFFTCWNEFFAALVLVTDEAKFTLPVTLTVLASNQLGTMNWGIMQAGVAVTAIPCIVLYLVLQRYYVAGLVAGAVK